MPTYQVIKDILWIQDHGQILVIEPIHQKHWILHDIEMIVWDMLQLSCSMTKISQDLSLILSATPEDSMNLVQQILEKWCSEQIIAKVDCEPDNQFNL